MKKERCKCGCVRFETIDITPDGCNEARYFIRCCRCGLVIFSTTHSFPTFCERIQHAYRMFMGIDVSKPLVTR